MRTHLALLALALPFTITCNSYPLFRLSGYKQESFNNKAEVVFIVDNSASMYDNTASLALAFNTFIDKLVDPNAGAGTRTETLSDAVTNFRNYVSDTGRYLDYQLALTTTSVDPGKKKAGEPPSGSNGKIAGAVPFISGATTDDVATTFKETLLCDLTAWPEPCGGGVEENCLNHDPAYVCGDPATEISIEYLECLCGKNWESAATGSGQEEGLMAAFLTMCRADPDALAKDPVLAAACAERLVGADTDSNVGLLRDDSSVIFVIVSDEGDDSNDLTYTDEDGNDVQMLRLADSGVNEYLDLLDRFGRRIAFAVVGPYYEDGSIICNTSSIQAWGAERYMNVASETGGFYSFIVQPAADYSSTGECEYPDFSRHLDSLGSMLNNMLNIFPLESVPQPETIMVFVDGLEVAEAECLDNCTASTGDDSARKPVYSDGWIYDSSRNAVMFTGDAVPGYNAEVRIYYLPVGELPRELPF